MTSGLAYICSSARENLVRLRERVLRVCVQGMKTVDMGAVFVVHSGEPWRHSQPPCSRQMIRFLEKNEGLVTWVQVPHCLVWCLACLMFGMTRHECVVMFGMSVSDGWHECV